MWVSCSARWLHEPSPPTRLIIFIVTDAEPSCPQTLHLFGEAGHAQTSVGHFLPDEDNVIVCNGFSDLVARYVAFKHHYDRSHALHIYPADSGEEEYAYYVTLTAIMTNLKNQRRSSISMLRSP